MTNVLIVDDEVSVREMIVSMIESLGCETYEAENGIKAKEVFDTVEIDLLVTDIVMPDMHGIDLIMDIKKTHENLPIIAISGGGGLTGRYDYLEIAKLVGAKNILKKPFSMDELCG